MTFPRLHSLLARHPWLTLGTALLLVVVVAIQSCRLTRAPLRLMFWGSKAEVETIANRLYLFALEPRGCRVKLNAYSSRAECRKQFLLQTRRGDPPDVCLISACDLALWADGKHARDLSTQPIDLGAFVPQTVTACSRGSGLYAVPAGWSVVALYFNRGIFARHGVPPPKAFWDWGDLLAAAQALTVTDEEDPRIRQYGLEVSPSVRAWMPLVWQNRGQPFNDDGTCSLMDPQFAQSNLKAIEFYADLVREQGVAPLPTKVRPFACEPKRFLSGKAAMTLAHRDFAAILGQQRQVDWDLAPLPTGAQPATWLEVCGYAVSAQSQHPTLAWELVQFLTSETTLASMTQVGGWAPARRSLLDSKVFRDFPGPRAVNNQALVDSLPFARLPPPLTDWDTAAAILSEEMDLLMTNDRIPARQALERMQARLDEMKFIKDREK